MKIPSKTLICALRVAPSFYKAVEQAVRDQNDPTVVLFQGQAKTYPDGTVNPSLFVQDAFDDHPGRPLTPAEKQEIQKKLADPGYTLRIVNSFAGEHASDRSLAGTYAIMHADMQYRAKGGVSKIVYDLLYDGEGRNDKIHEVMHTGANGVAQKISEDNAPAGMYGPLTYKRNGADGMTVFDPHSRQHERNLTAAFGEANVSVLSNLQPVAAAILAQHKAAILAGRFRIGAPDGWDKKDDPERNAAIVRIQTVASMIWDSLPELHGKYMDAKAFLAAVQFGIIKVREAAYPGAPAKPKVKQLIGSVAGCDCVLLDDLADSGGSLIQSGTALLEAGANKVAAAVCHGPAAEASLQRILHETCTLDDGNGGTKAVVVVNQLILTNSMPRVENFYANLSAQDRKRTSLVNSAQAYLAHLSR